MLKLIVVFMVGFNYCFGQPILIGIAGGSGSGKTSLSKAIQDRFATDVTIIAQDNYYKDRSHLPASERLNCIFDHPDAIEFSLLKDQLISLKQGKGIDYPQYDFNKVGRGGSKYIEPTRLIIVEGTLIFAVPEIRELLDLKVFIDVDDDIRFLRRLERDFRERSHNLEIARTQYLQSTKPMHDLFVGPSKQFADLIIPSTRDNSQALQVLGVFFQKRLSSSE